MPDTTVISIIAFLAVSSLFLLVMLLVGGRASRLDDRLSDLSSGNKPEITIARPTAMARAVHRALPKVGKALVPENMEEQGRLRTRLVHAGLYSAQSMVIFLGVKMLLMVMPAVIGLMLGVSRVVPTTYGILFGACASICGVVGPSFWLDRRKSKRQTTLRRSLPDALDLVVICLEGGLSLASALQRVIGELNTAHPELANEMNIVQREAQLGQTMGEALRNFSQRCDLEEVRSLAAVVQQAEKFGASMVKTLRVHADTLRQKRLQRAEEMAQKAGTKILFPTLLFIFPAIFLVILGPAAIQIMQLLKDMKK